MVPGEEDTFYSVIQSLGKCAYSWKQYQWKSLCHQFKNSLWKQKGTVQEEEGEQWEWEGENGGGCIWSKCILCMYENMLKLIIMCNQYMLVKTAKKITVKLVFQTSYSYRLHQPWCSPKQGLLVRSCLVLSPGAFSNETYAHLPSGKISSDFALGCLLWLSHTMAPSMFEHRLVTLRLYPPPPQSLPWDKDLRNPSLLWSPQAKTMFLHLPNVAAL